MSSGRRANPNPTPNPNVPVRQYPYPYPYPHPLPPTPTPSQERAALEMKGRPTSPRQPLGRRLMIIGCTGNTSLEDGSSERGGLDIVWGKPIPTPQKMHIDIARFFA